MNPEHPISLLIYVTFGVALLIAIVLAVRVMRRRDTRKPMEGERERNIEEIRREGPEA